MQYTKVLVIVVYLMHSDVYSAVKEAFYPHSWFALSILCQLNIWISVDVFIRR